MTFFSGTDTSTLLSEGSDRNCFVSLIVNNSKSYSAAITIKPEVSTKIIKTVKYRNHGNPLKTFNRKIETIKQEVWYYMLDVEIRSSIPAERVQELAESIIRIKKEKEEEKKKTTVVHGFGHGYPGHGTYNTNEGNWGDDWESDCYNPEWKGANHNWKDNPVNIHKTASKTVPTSAPTFGTGKNPNANLSGGNISTKSLPAVIAKENKKSNINLSKVYAIVNSIITCGVNTDARYIQRHLLSQMEDVYDKEFRGDMYGFILHVDSLLDEFTTTQQISAAELREYMISVLNVLRTLKNRNQYLTIIKDSIIELIK